MSHIDTLNESRLSISRNILLTIVEAYRCFSPIRAFFIVKSDKGGIIFYLSATEYLGKCRLPPCHYHFLHSSFTELTPYIVSDLETI